jgi:tRNA (guanine-N7-)-methyltransferase
VSVDRRQAPRGPAAPRDLPVAGRRTDALVQVDLAACVGPFDLRGLFVDDRPVELEVGVGKGRFILLAAVARPEVNFLGVERARRFFAQAVERVGKRALTNVRLVWADATTLLAERIPDRSLAGCHVYFPDPWPKKRHHKRRFIRPETLTELARVLRPEALLRVVTDHPEYALLIREVVAADENFVDAGADAALWELPGMGDYTTLGVTNFEIKYRREGRPIHRFAWRRRRSA